MCRKLSVFLLVLLVVSCCVWALPGAKKATAIQEEVVVEGGVQETSTSQDLQSQSLPETTETLTTLNELMEYLKKNNFILGNQQIGNVAEKVEKAIENVSSDIDITNTLLLAQQEQIEALKKDALSTRFFADFGVAVGFKEDDIRLGMLGEMGIKFGKGWLLKTGVQWMAVDGSQIKTLFKTAPSFKIEDMTITCTFGYEW